MKDLAALIFLIFLLTFLFLGMKIRVCNIDSLVCKDYVVGGANIKLVK